MQSRDLDELLEEAKWGRLSSTELQAVVDALVQSQLGEPRYTLMHVLKRAGSPEVHEELVASYLESPDEPMLARIALQTLRDWGLAARYRDDVWRLALGVDWDHEYGDVRQIALFTAGELLQSQQDTEMLELLLSVAQSPAEDEIHRRNAIRALALAIGRSRDQIPFGRDRLDVDGEWASGVISKARERLAAERSGTADTDPRMRASLPRQSERLEG